MLSAQLFQTAAGARSDFGQFFTNQHPETIYEPGTYWRGAVSIRLGDRATLYHIEDDGSRCPRHLTTGLSFVFGNALFSVGVCSLPSGDSQSRDLAQRLLAHARIVKR
jgi:hypothetical protein